MMPQWASLPCSIVDSLVRGTESGRGGGRTRANDLAGSEWIRGYIRPQRAPNSWKSTTGECVQSQFLFATQANEKQAVGGTIGDSQRRQRQPRLAVILPILTSAALARARGTTKKRRREGGSNLPTSLDNDTYRHTRQSSGLGRSYCSRRGDVFENAAFTRPTTTLFFFPFKNSSQSPNEICFYRRKGSSSKQPIALSLFRPSERFARVTGKEGVRMGKCRPSLVFLRNVSWR